MKATSIVAAMSLANPRKPRAGARVKARESVALIARLRARHRCAKAWLRMSAASSMQRWRY